MTLAFDDTLLTGIEDIESQHREIFSRFDSFSNACSGLESYNGLMKLVGFFESYSSDHFNFEEKVMQDAGFPNLEAHRNEHRSFRADITRLKMRISEVGSEDRTPIFFAEKILFKWLKIHIGHSDREIVDFLNPSTVRSNSCPECL
jgi:hemerythrin